MKSPLNKPLMLAIILYTDVIIVIMTVKVKEKAFQKWVVFDYCLYVPIHKLSQAEYGRYPVYTEYLM